MEEEKTKRKEKKDFMFLKRSATIESSTRLNFNKSTRRLSTESLMSCGFRRPRTETAMSSIQNQQVDFWKRHFDPRTNVSWTEFRSAFLQDYGNVIYDFSPKRVNWILSIVHMDIFEGRDLIYKMHYDKYCGKSSKNPDRLWMKVKQYATERIFREGLVESLFE